MQKRWQQEDQNLLHHLYKKADQVAVLLVLFHRHQVWKEHPATQYYEGNNLKYEIAWLEMPLMIGQVST